MQTLHTDTGCECWRWKKHQVTHTFKFSLEKRKQIFTFVRQIFTGVPANRCLPEHSFRVHQLDRLCFIIHQCSIYLRKGTFYHIGLHKSTMWWISNTSVVFVSYSSTFQWRFTSPITWVSVEEQLTDIWEPHLVTPNLKSATSGRKKTGKHGGWLLITSIPGFRGG